MEIYAESDGKTVWVHDPFTGLTIARFGQMAYEVQINYTTETMMQQMQHGGQQPTTAEDWVIFANLVDERFDYQIAECHRPRRFSAND